MFEKDNIKIDDMVLIKEDNVPVSNWPFGRIVKLYPGKDNIIRSGQPKLSALAGDQAMELFNYPPLRFDHIIQWINISTIPLLRNDHSPNSPAPANLFAVSNSATLEYRKQKNQQEFLFGAAGRGGLVVRSRLWGRRVKSYVVAKRPPVGAAWKFGDGVLAHLSSLSSDRDSKLRGPSQNSPRVASKRDVNITKLFGAERQHRCAFAIDDCPLPTNLHVCLTGM
ncbi:hypothetical protein AVEN_179183-1 [Araneus ventricosus]|uniref:DUF5641 domain-containing protein n=1 Tax=Araneus ventricosus TaxID=182803 RepID=A0A4Y2C7M2_ARAVE|nr:hypothetical protein AVEN_179183-1 [Araneus ventricosus]